MPKLLFIVGSLRAASASKATAKALMARIGDRADCEMAEIGTLPHYNADVTDHPEVDAFKAAIAEADGLVFVTPEYNYSIPGVLKNAIDWASRPAYESVFKGKPCFIVSVSGGALGGVRAQAHLKYVLNGMLAEVMPAKEIVVTMANTKVENGVLHDDAVLDFATDAMTAFVGRMAA
ncbi:NAD(P)H-dependent oxidoreductase [Rhodobacterales bacterium HKCCE3408]|nr:NAD(P)H-dependent oxidoreductase [Rhodobacterales bacterium HKCCE3408]